MESNSDDELLSIGSDNDTEPESTKRAHVNVESSSDVNDEAEAEEIISAAACTQPRVEMNEAEVTLSDDEEDEQIENVEDGESSPQINERATSENNLEDSTGYGLRRKRKINYTEMENGNDDDDGGNPDKDKKSLKKEVLDIFNLPTARILKYTRNPDLIDSYNKCKIVYFDGTDSERLNVVSKFFDKCGHQFEDLFIRTRYDLDNYKFFQTVFKNTTALGKLTYKYHNGEDAYQILKLIKDLLNGNHLQALHSIKLVSVSGGESLRQRHLEIISEYPIKLRNLEVGDALWEDVKSNTLEKLLENQKENLETLVIHGGFRGDTGKEKILITIPKMEVLIKLHICPNYSFLSEIKNPYSKKARMITLDAKTEEPFKIAIKFQNDLPKLKRLVLGNLIDIDDLLFLNVRRLSEFRCGSHWNLSISFPSENSRKSLLESAVTEFQFPDALKDPTFVVKVSKHFPNLRKVWMFLPSVPVLRAFFKAFETSNLEEFYLKTQFDFESTMESCLLPRLSDVLQKSQATETLVRTLKEYKHFDEYVKYYNIELPVEEEDLMEGHSAGIRALCNLKILHLEHIPRRLLIPIPDDERKWYDHNCKFMSTTFGYERYPLKYRCHQEIMQLNLSEYIWKNIQINSEFTEEFYEAGFVDMPDVQVLGYESGMPVEEEEDIFEPVQRRATSNGTHVKVLPSMLFPDIKVKPEEITDYRI
ncbi:unnamed protein product [Orchesella dallaii]|uniref:Uncharacterized protein n=1 Tax=Orchesella dallaii TaxID=48710 RepID=A0ABP1QF86_9HEXA